MPTNFRALYIVNWVYRYHTESFYDPIVIGKLIITSNF